MKSNLITVIHKAFKGESGTNIVAYIKVNPAAHVNDALEYAYELTQNKKGSWSKGRYFQDGSENKDYRDSINFVGQYPVRKSDGFQLGARSTSEGDHLIYKGIRYEVAGWGFDELPKYGPHLTQALAEIKAKEAV